jgi:hypothetical protein
VWLRVAEDSSGAAHPTASNSTTTESEVLRPLGQEQSREGNVTIRNQYGQLRRAYEYFREGVETAYCGDGRLAKTRPAGGGWWFAPERHQAWWNTFAMVVAYFSLVEHVVVGCLPFSRFDPTADNVVAFIGLKWNENTSGSSMSTRMPTRQDS